MSEQTSPTRSPEELQELCRLRGFLLVAFLLQVIGWFLDHSIGQSQRHVPAPGTGAAGLALLISLACLVFLIISMYGSFRLARALGRKIPAAIVYALLMFFLLFGLVAYLTLAREVTRILEASKGQVESTSANQDDLDQLKDQITSQDAAPTAENPAGGNEKVE